MSNLDLRSAKRYRVEAPVFFWWSSPDKCIHKSRGTTHDISSCGAFITADCCPPGKVRIHLEIRLPANAGYHGMLLQGEGLVVRVKSLEGASACAPKAGFAVYAHFYPEKIDAAHDPGGYPSEESLPRAG